MITYTCDICGKQIDINQTYGELVIRTKNEVLVPQKNVTLVRVNKLETKVCHFCPDCLKKIEKLCQPTEDKKSKEHFSK